MGNYIIEKEWLTDEGLQAVCVMGEKNGYRYGYVGVPRGTMLDEVHHADKRLADIGVHGGLVYSGWNGRFPVEGNIWWFGFECGRCGEIARHFGDQEDIECTQEYVESECESLARQLSRLMYNLSIKAYMGVK